MNEQVNSALNVNLTNAQCLIFMHMRGLYPTVHMPAVK